MKYAKLLLVGSLAVSMTACGTFGNRTATKEVPIKSPTPEVTKDQTVAAAGRVENAVTIDVPAWYIKAPASTEEYTYVTGTGLSSDLGMSREKAMLDAQVRLAEKINGVVNSMTKQVKKDDSGSVNSDRTSMVVKKLAIDVAIAGHHLEDSKIMAENRGYRTFVLVRYPIGDANRILKDRIQRERSNDASSGDENELDKFINKNGKSKSEAVPEGRAE